MYIHIFMFCPTSFFSNQIQIDQLCRAKHEYMNTHPRINIILATALHASNFLCQKAVPVRYGIHDNSTGKVTLNI